jgi:hypothetical protein
VPLGHATAKYPPKPADVREAIVTAHWRLRKMLKALDRAYEHRESINDTILLHARDQASKVLGYREETTVYPHQRAQERAGLPVDVDDEEESPRRAAACRERSEVERRRP